MKDTLADRTIDELGKLKGVWLDRLKRCRSAAAEIAVQERALLGTIRRVQGEIDRRFESSPRPLLYAWRDVVAEVIETAPANTAVRNIARAVEKLCIEKGLAAPTLPTIIALVRRVRSSA